MDVDSIVDYFSNHDEGVQRLPDKPSVYYTFAGEIPWCDSYPYYNTSEFSFLVRQRTVKVRRKIPKIFRDKKEPSTSQPNPAEIVESKESGDQMGHTQGAETDDPLALGIQWVHEEIEELENEYVRFDALIPVCDFGWEGHQTLASDPGRACLLAKEIAQELQTGRAAPDFRHV